jgi:hypothetical protein
MFDRVLFICLGVYLFLVGLFAVTNLQVEWSRPIMGFAALVAGALCFARGARGVTTGAS